MEGDGFMVVRTTRSNGYRYVSWYELDVARLSTFMSDMIQRGERFEILEVHHGPWPRGAAGDACTRWQAHFETINQEGEEQ